MAVVAWFDVDVDVDVAVTVASVVVPIASVLMHLRVMVLASRASAALPSSLRTKLGPSGARIDPFPPDPLPPYEPELVGGRGAGHSEVDELLDDDRNPTSCLHVCTYSLL